MSLICRCAALFDALVEVHATLDCCNTKRKEEATVVRLIYGATAASPLLVRRSCFRGSFDCVQMSRCSCLDPECRVTLVDRGRGVTFQALVSADTVLHSRINTVLVYYYTILACCRGSLDGFLRSSFMYLLPHRLRVMRRSFLCRLSLLQCALHAWFSLARQSCLVVTFAVCATSRSPYRTGTSVNSCVS